ncbi:hypothetical protein AMC90_PD00903 (plasmid) [Rhizobium phaseoli]|uniref:Uncharacterized protein n=1 Tax=Rhizobium phaseoli TaxID=396 RepID=A0ABN4QWV5_9HYPH|nr:hypothetical protein [Rhizobium phaseoli]KEC71339.1 hypothetical protein RLPCCGM1_p0070 [Rhizobium leguminosarum bv. phaseoli CCGM1]ANL31928.1 hypothetical protein AMC90_PD00903 [Rhizobium phaseoli]ANL89098.1 hypothetical protein AMC81_PE00855 [Rhizobium phaseoli]ANL95607.1 hypothetical protein AMC80_PE00855 [Rhizobium phaseoli]ARM16152.1 hypothetical protein Bra5_PD00609 [Rhizobium phaseoli Brasil 5]
MRRRILLSLILCAQFASMSAASELAIFYTASLGSSRSVSLSLADDRPARDPAFDFDVVITLSEFDGAGTVLYRDGGRHEASVRCVSPAMVRIKSVNYAIDVSMRPGADWKHDLWAALCTAPVS